MSDAQTPEPTEPAQHSVGKSPKPVKPKQPPVDGIERENKPIYFLPITLWVAFAFVVASLLAAFSEPVLGWFGVSKANTDANIYNAITAFIYDALLVLITLGVPALLKLWSARIKYSRLIGFTRTMRWRDIIFALLGFAVYFAALVIVLPALGKIIPGFNGTQAQDLGFSKVLSPASILFVFISLVVVAPIAEEIIFRGYLFGTLRRTLPVGLAALITSALFAAAHMQWNVGVDVFILSLVSCFLRYKTGSLWASILLHMAKNGLAFYVLYLSTSSFF